MRHSFDEVNFYSLKKGIHIPFEEFFRRHFEMTSIFIQDIQQRLIRRLKHGFGGKTLHDQFAAITKGRGKDVKDNKKLAALIDFVNDPDPTPFFSHVHFLGTHGMRFKVRKRVFSKHHERQTPWIDDFYDDAVLEADEDIAELIEHLDQSNRLKNTIIVFYSDHGSRYNADVRTSLIFWFSKKREMKNTNVNVHNLDVAPTILDYLNVPVPNWMEGEPFFKDTRKKNDTIISIISKRGYGGLQTIPPTNNPYAHPKSIIGIVCEKVFKLNLKNGQMKTRRVRGYGEDSCREEEIPAQEAIKNQLLDHLEDRSFDISRLR